LADRAWHKEMFTVNASTISDFANNILSGEFGCKIVASEVVCPGNSKGPYRLGKGSSS